VNKKQKQSGFSHIMIITIILAVALVGTLGYVFYQNFIQKKDTTVSGTSTASKTTSDKTTATTPTTTNATTPAATTKTTSTTTTTPTNPNAGYLVLSDWGVKFKVPSDTGNREIRYYKGNQNGGDYYRFTTSEVEQLGGECSIASIFTVSRSTKTPQQAPNDTWVTDGALLKQIGGYYYYQFPSLSDCSNGASSLPAQDYTLVHELVTSMQQS